MNPELPIYKFRHYLQRRIGSQIVPSFHALQLNILQRHCDVSHEVVRRVFLAHSLRDFFYKSNVINKK